jgi:hypothetical protein
MRLRPQSELGWLMLQWLAVLVLGHNVQKDPGLLGGQALPVPVVTELAPQTLAPAASRDTTERAGPVPLWWLSFVSEADVFLGLAIVEGGSETEAVLRAHQLGIHPGGQLMGFEVPPEYRATCEPHQDRSLTADEARALFEAKPIREWEESGGITPEMLEHLDAAGVVVTDTQPPPPPEPEPEWLPPLDHCQVCSGPASTERPVVIVRDGLGRPWAEHVGDCPRDS